MKTSPKQGLFGWKGMRPDSTNDTTITTIITIINIVLLLVMMDNILEKKDGIFTLRRDTGDMFFYIKSITAIYVSILSSFFIRYEDSNARWAARIFCCYLPATAAIWLLLKAL